MKNIIISAIIIIVTSLSALYILHRKKHHSGCIGCPCSGKCGSCKKDTKKCTL